MDIAQLMAAFVTGTYTVTRRARGRLVHGKITDGATTTVLITASVSPASGKDLLRLPEGRRTNESRVVFTTTELYTGGQVGSETQATYQADRILIDGKDYEVSHVETWRDPVTQTSIGYRVVVQDLN